MVMYLPHLPPIIPPHHPHWDCPNKTLLIASPLFTSHHVLMACSWCTTISNDGRVTLVDPQMLRRSCTVVQIYVNFEATQVDPDQYQKIVSIFSIYTIGEALPGFSNTTTATTNCCHVVVFRNDPLLLRGAAKPQTRWPTICAT